MKIDGSIKYRIYPRTQASLARTRVQDACRGALSQIIRSAINMEYLSPTSHEWHEILLLDEVVLRSLEDVEAALHGIFAGQLCLPQVNQGLL